MSDGGFAVCLKEFPSVNLQTDILSTTYPILCLSSFCKMFMYELYLFIVCYIIQIS